MRLFRRSRVLALTALLGVLAFATARAAVDVTITNNTQVTSKLLEADSVQRYRVFVPAGAKLSVAVKGKKDKKAGTGAPNMRMRILDDFETDIIEDGFLDKAKLKAKGTGAKAKVVIEDTDLYIIEVFTEDGTTGTFSLVAKWASPKVAKIKDEVFEGFGTDVEVSVDEDAQLTMSVKAKGGSAKPYFDVIEGDEFDQDLDNLPKLKKITVLEGGDLFIVIGNDVGEGKITGSVKIKPPKTKKLKVPIEPDAEGTEEKKVTGAVAVPSKDTLVEADDEDIVGEDIVGASVLIPAGAVSQPTSVQIGTADPLLPPNPEIGIGAGPTVFFGPPGLEFESPVTVTIPFDADLLDGGSEDDLSVFTEDEDGNVEEITEFDVDVDEESVSFQVSHFSTFRVFIAGFQAGESDLDGDGIDDLILPAPEAADGAGRVYVFSGVPELDGDASEADVTIQGAGTGEMLGESYAVGDVDGDGQDDLAVVGQGAGDGFCLLFAGGPSFGPTSPSDAAVRINGESGLGGMNTVAVGDVNADGIDDLAIGCEDGRTGEGNVFVFFGSSTFQVQTTTVLTTAQADLVFTGEQVGDLFGAAVAIGDVTGDDVSDLVVGADMIDNPGRTGRVYIQIGGPNIQGSEVAFYDVVLVGSAADAGFGLNVAIGDVTGDGNDDLIASEFDDDLGGPGAVFVFAGGSDLGGGEISGTSGAIAEYRGTEDEVVGSSLQVADVTGDGTPDLVIGARGAAQGDGGFFVFTGGSGVVGADRTLLTPDISGPGFFEGFPILTAPIRSAGDSVIIAFAPGNEDGDIGAGAAYLFFGDPRDLGEAATTDDADVTIFGQEGDSLGGELF
jgi:hypothetical protein